MVIVIIAEIALFSFTPIYGLITWRRSKKRMKSGDDKQKLKDLVYSIIKCDEEFKVVYAYWYEGYRPKWHKYYRFTYWYFAIGFNRIAGTYGDCFCSGTIYHGKPGDRQ